MSELLLHYSYMEHKEQVRIAVSKSIGNSLFLSNLNSPVFYENVTCFKSYLNFISALILLLNDEQPDIRYYLCHKEEGQQSLTSFVEANQEWTIQPEEEAKEGYANAGIKV